MGSLIKQLGPLAGATRFRRISEKLYADGDLIYRNAGIDFKATWFPIYYLLSKPKDNLTITQIADEIGFTHVTVKNVLGELKGKGLVSIRANPADGRSKLIALSQKGTNLLEKLQPIWLQFSKVLNDILCEGHPDTITILDNIDNALERKPISERIRELNKKESIGMEVKYSTRADVIEIFRLYRLATEFQKTRFEVHWPEFELELVASEIDDNRQYKLEEDGKIACVWAIAFNDPLIWGERDKDSAVYIHRIATNPDFRGRNLVTKIVAWAKSFAAENDIGFIRMDTVGKNQGLIDYYRKCGFEFLGLSKLEKTEELPAHYDNATVSLFQLDLKNQRQKTMETF